MKSLSSVLNETLNEKNYGSLDKRDLIECWLKKYNIKYYTINDDLTIDVNGNVDLDEYPESELPEFIQFGVVGSKYNHFSIRGSKLKTLRGCPLKVEGGFYCSSCPKLTSLEGCPTLVSNINCSRCSNLKSLKGCPEKVGDLNCSHCPKLTTLEGCPKRIYGDYLDCSYCKNLTSLEGCPEEFGGLTKLICSHCPKLESLKGSPKRVWTLDCSYCKNLSSLEGCPETIQDWFTCNNCENLTSFEGGPKKVGGIWCFDCGVEFDEWEIKRQCNATFNVKVSKR